MQWQPEIDPATIPDEVLLRERARRNAHKRKTYSGGVVWRKHNPNTNRCRCVECSKKRLDYSLDPP